MTTKQLWKSLVEWDNEGNLVKEKSFTIKGSELAELKEDLEYVVKGINILQCVSEKMDIE